MIDPLYTLCGFAVGALVGLTGVGGGSLMTPVLILMFGVHPATAVGTDLLFAACTKSVGALVHARSQTIDWTVTRRLATGSIPATALVIGALTVMHARTDMISGTITPILAVALLITAVLVVFQKQVLRFVAVRDDALSPRLRAGLTVAAGVVLGVLVSLSSVGAGALGVTALTLLYPRLPTPRVVGSDIVHAIPLTLLAGMGYWLMGSVNWPLLGSLLSGSIPGIVVGSLLATRVPAEALRTVLATVLVVAAGKLLM